ncbi:peptidylprolyl isomerase [Castellaniella daejeonensis]|jgi:peptidyl-prolyl cis-trans isomerase C|uniref:peptidylprolyl isomerase n=1 Tax=Castellaniella daejeonensis TaxID=659013 RepID=A0ABP3DP66_9BURK|nr:peptidylprolyl isomerase [Castellaniella sp.]HET8704462.1 peptidylprolyl isomerase [Castellaniella sp.]
MKRIAAVALACSLTLPVWAKDIASVNGQGIPQEKFDQFVSMLVAQGAQDTPQLRAQVKQEMINRLVAVQAAEKAGLQKDPAVRQETELATQSILVRALMAKYLKDHPVTDADLQKEYNDIKAEQGSRQEYKLRHILVKDEAKAKDLIKAIKAKKTTFEAAAKKDSIDTGSGKNGGELGWGPTSNYVPEFAQAVESMKKGDLSAQPVQTQFGWHVIQVEDVRPIAFPSFEEAKPQLEEMMRQQALADYQKSLMKDAKIVDNADAK